MNLLANLVANINLGYQHKKKYVICYSSNFVINILKLLTKLRLIYGFTLLPNLSVKIYMLYIYEKPAISKILLISKPSRRITMSYKQICKKFPRARGILFYSSSRGLKTNYHINSYFVYAQNKSNKNVSVGGELLFLIQENKRFYF